MKNILTWDELNETTTGALSKSAGYSMSPQGAKSSAWSRANAAAEEKFGEYGLATCDEEDMNKIIDIKKANAIAKKMFGEFGFATCKEDEMEQLINENPTLLR